MRARTWMKKKSLKIWGSDNRIGLWKVFCDIFFVQEGIGRFMWRVGSDEFLWYHSRTSLSTLIPPPVNLRNYFVATFREIYEQVDSQLLPMILVKQTRHSWRDKKTFVLPESQSFEQFGLVIAHVVRVLGSGTVTQQDESRENRKNELGLAGFQGLALQLPPITFADRALRFAFRSQNCFLTDLKPPKPR